MEDLPNEIFVEIFTHLTTQKDLISLELVSKAFYNLIRNTRWIHIPFRLKNLQYFDFVISTYKISNYNLINTNIIYKVYII